MYYYLLHVRGTHLSMRGIHSYCDNLFETRPDDTTRHPTKIRFAYRTGTVQRPVGLLLQYVTYEFGMGLCPAPEGAGPVVAVR